MEIIIAMENPKAIITNKALILRLEIFLNALVTIPNFIHLSKHSRKKTTKKREWRGVRVLALTVFVGNNFVTLLLFIMVILLFGCLSLLNEKDLLNNFSKLDPILFQIYLTLSGTDVIIWGHIYYGNLNRCDDESLHARSCIDVC